MEKLNCRCIHNAVCRYKKVFEQAYSFIIHHEDVFNWVELRECLQKDCRHYIEQKTELHDNEPTKNDSLKYLDIAFKKLSLGGKLRYLRKNTPTDTTQLLQRIGITHYNTYSRYENDTRIPPMAVLRELAKFYSIDYKLLINED